MIERLAHDATYSPVELSIHLARYQLASPFVEGKRVLDVACGEGFGAYFLAEKCGAASVAGVDISLVAIDAARANFAHENITFHQHDALKLGELFHEPFDTIVCSETIEHLADPQAFLRQLQQLTHAESTIIITCPNDAYYFGAGATLNKFHQRAYSFSEFRELTVDVLGDAEWFLGAPAQGFGIYRQCECEAVADDYVSSMREVKPAAARIVATSGDQQLTAERALFYAGVWRNNRSEQTDSISSSATLFPAQSDFRLGSISNVAAELRSGKRRKLALVVDTEDWAYHNIANHIMANLSDRYDMQIFFTSRYPGNADDLFYELFYEYEPDNIHFFWREQIFNFLKNPARIQKMLLHRELDLKEFSRRFSRCAISTTVYDHLHSAHEAIEERVKPLGLIDAYSVASPFLAEIYESGFPVAPAQMTEDGVSIDQFRPANLERFQNHDRPLVIGWAGNSQWGEKHADDPKGYHSIVLPSMEQLQQEGLNLTGHFADRNLKWRSREEMPQYYSEIDVLVCASLHEGTPNPVLEAMACGVPVISTNVGIVRMALGRKQAEFILPERNAAEMMRLLRKFHDHRSLLAVCSAENLESIRCWDWSMKMTKWLSLFRAAEQRHEVQHPFKYTCMLQMLETMEIVKRVKDANERLRTQVDNMRKSLDASVSKT
jgi:glycosyltransferase involved in cell wall biosynthesis